MLSLSPFTLTVAGQRLLRADALTLQPGEILTLLGPSGSGKSSLLTAMAGIAATGVCLTGQLWLGSRDVSSLPAHARRIGYVDQRPVLFPHLSVLQNITFGLRGGSRQRRAALGVEALQTAGLAALAQADPATLSGGQAARVALMRTLVSAPNALLLDEPFAALDPALRADMRAFVFAQIRATGLPTLLVTHDGADARAAAGPVYRLENHTLVRQDGPHA